MTLCLKTMRKNIGASHVLNVVTPENVREFLPELRTDLDDPLYLKVPAKADIIRVQLLRKYGGLWLDADVILFKEPSFFTDKLKEFDFVVMSKKPDNWLLASKPSGELIDKWAERQNTLLDEKDRRFFRQNYFSLGREILRDLTSLEKVCFLSPICSGRDSERREITNRMLWLPGVPEKACADKRIIMHLRNTSPGFLGTVKRASEERILESNTLMGNMFRQALGMESLEQESRGLGDTVKKITEAVGIKQCGSCAKRQKKLNRLFPYKPKTKVVE